MNRNTADRLVSQSRTESPVCTQTRVSMASSEGLLILLPPPSFSEMVVGGLGL